LAASGIVLSRRIEVLPGTSLSEYLGKQDNGTWICNIMSTVFHIRTVHLDVIKVLLPTDAQENFFKRIIKIYIKTALTCFGAITIIRESTK
jgi:hypothetical protein